MPRIVTRSVDVEYVMPGVKFAMSWMVWMPILSRASLVNADTATGTFCRFSARFSAVTTTVSMSAEACTVRANKNGKIEATKVEDRALPAGCDANIFPTPAVRALERPRSDVLTRRQVQY